MYKSASEMVAEAVAHYEHTKLVMLEIEAVILSRKSDWLSKGVPTDAASRVADEARLMAAKVENHKAKMRLAELKSIAKKIKANSLTSLLMKHLVDSGNQDVVNAAMDMAAKTLDDSGFLEAYRL